MTHHICDCKHAELERLRGALSASLSRERGLREENGDLRDTVEALEASQNPGDPTMPWRNGEDEERVKELVRTAKWVLRAWESDALEVGYEAVEDAAEALRAAIAAVENEGG